VSGPRAVLFTDLDGTLLDHDTYSPGAAAEALPRLAEEGVLVVACSAKTRAEQQRLTAELGLPPVFITENGGAVVWWDGFPATPPGPETVVPIGRPYAEVRAGLGSAAGEAGVEVVGYGDATVDEIADRTGLDPASAGLARRREHTETFWITDGDASSLEQALARRGLRMVRGSRFWTAQAEHDKGTAIAVVLDRLAGPLSFAVGDAPNDREMLEAVDHPMLVERPGGGWVDLGLPGVELVEGIGPIGWVEAARWILRALATAG
jgi:mannosyl-3-phosphoglycerate phosphatase